MHRFLIAAFLMLTACGTVTVSTATPRGPSPSPQRPAQEQPVASAAARQFVEVVQTVEPVAEAACRRAASQDNCDFLIVADDRPGQPANAFQTVDSRGRPILAFNLALISSVENPDELAFVMGHEASHHILAHINRMQDSASVGAVIFSGIAAVTGANADAVRTAESLGAQVGARTFSKDFELEADRLGTIITARAGYDPVRGALFFNRIPDPGNRFLGTHPPNSQRMDVVRRTVAEMGGR
ncbi:M48 family metallopeptidase [Allosediminivita pacifica]|uniref:Peptidase M48-like protein n=1 Tax=Allosediminivita pacifica TaxID=1267769 RepID=A0A2T6B408_9RHOB|nr:M48 family metallopeptidase [Allosediminivita pacifica]PTX50808.1 peptidase M48-like protein [Allosediminivita pacifica]GGB01311.1 peptidase M48 [Allosediminivita pacifica]